MSPSKKRSFVGTTENNRTLDKRVGSPRRLAREERVQGTRADQGVRPTRCPKIRSADRHGPGPCLGLDRLASGQGCRWSSREGEPYGDLPGRHADGRGWERSGQESRALRLQHAWKQVQGIIQKLQFTQ